MPPLITSASNERVKHARRVREGREPDLTFVDGLRLAEEAVKSGIVVEAAFVASGNDDERLVALVEQLVASRAPLFWTQSNVLDGMSDTVQSQGIVLIAKRPEHAALPNGATLFLALDRIQDPGNMGTLLRTAEAAGADGVIALGGSVDVFSPKVLRSSMGSAFRLPVMTDVTAEMLLQLKREHRLHLVAASGEGELDYTDYDWSQPTLLLLGNEGRGVSPELMTACDTRLRIPMANDVESLNVAAAGAVMLFEAARQRRL
jgi:RNA methyltransferase, TrmH family